MDRKLIKRNIKSRGILAKLTEEHSCGRQAKVVMQGAVEGEPEQIWRLIRYQGKT